MSVIIRKKEWNWGRRDLVCKVGKNTSVPRCCAWYIQWWSFQLGLQEVLNRWTVMIDYLVFPSCGYRWGPRAECPVHLSYTGQACAIILLSIFPPISAQRQPALDTRCSFSKCFSSAVLLSSHESIGRLNILSSFRRSPRGRSAATERATFFLRVCRSEQ